MPQSEAENYAARYKPGVLDSAKTLLDKHDRLTDELTRFRAKIYEGRKAPPLGAAPVVIDGYTIRAK
jgi:hypothetical protein